MDSTDEKQEPEFSRCRRLKWIVVCFCSLLDLGSVIALGPSVLALQEQILRDSTNCEVGSSSEGLSCAAELLKFSVPVGSTKAFLSFLLAVPYGTAADRFGRRPLFIISIFGSFLSLPFLLGSPKSVMPFFIMDTVGALLPDEHQLVSTITADVSDPDMRAQNYALLLAVTMSIAVLGSGLGSAFVATYGPSGLVIGSLTLSVVQLTVVILFLPETRPTQKEAETGKATSKKLARSLSNVLIGEKNASLVSTWQRSYFWLYLLSGFPEAAMGSIGLIFLQDRFSFTPAIMGIYASLTGTCAFFWLLIGFRSLSRLLPNQGRIFQLVKMNYFVCQIIMLLSNKGWVPFALSFPGGMSVLENVVLKGIMLHVTDESELGTVNGYFNTCDALVGMVGPPLGGLIFSLTKALGLMNAPYLFLSCGPVPILMAIASFTLLPESMPPSLQARLAGLSNKEVTSERLLSTEDDQQPAPEALKMSPEAWERKHPPLSMAVKYVAPVLFIISVLFIAGNEQEFACRDRSFYEAKAAVSVIAGSDPDERKGELVFFRGDLERGSIVNQTLADLGPYFDFPPDFESPSLAVSVEVKQCATTRGNSEYAVEWSSSYIDSSEFDRGPKTGLFEMVCGAENYWNPLLPHPGLYDADAGKVGAFTILWAHVTQEIALNALLVNSSILTGQAINESFYAGPKNCGPGFSFCQDWKGNQTPNDIGEARVSMKAFDWDRPTMTILGNNSGGSISYWKAPNGWLCNNFGRSYVGVVKTGTHSVDHMLRELKTAVRIRTWILRILGFALAGLMFGILARPFHISDDCIACGVPWRPHLRLPITMATQGVIGVSCLLSLALCLLIAGCVWVVTWPFLGSALFFIAACISFYFLYIHRKHGILMKAGARTSMQAETSKDFQDSGIQ